jgi:hypothetical protein
MQHEVGCLKDCGGYRHEDGNKFSTNVNVNDLFIHDRVFYPLR